MTIQRTLLLAVAVLTAAPAAPAAWKSLPPDSVQRIYLHGVPHTDRNGRPLTRYDPDRSFFPIAIYHAVTGNVGGTTYSFATLADAGFNACHLWEGIRPTAAIQDAERSHLQLITHWPTDAEVAALKDHPNILAWYLDEEPIGQYWSNDMDGHFKKFLARRDAIKKLDPTHPVFPLDSAWIIAPATDWFLKWNTAGDVTSHDNYPVNQHHQSLSYNQGIPESVSLVVKANHEQKPMWFCLQTFEAPGPNFPFEMPSARQVRCMTYTAIIHGATGILDFAFDSQVTRNGDVVGIAPDPKPAYGRGLAATADQLRASKDLWSAVTALNRELAALRPAILSPTADVPYTVLTDDAWKPVTKTPIRTLLKTHPDGGYVLLLANIDESPQRVRIEFPANGTPYTFTPLFEPSPAAGHFRSDDHSFDFTATGYDVRIVRIMPKAH